MVANPLMERDPLAQIRSQTAAVISAYQDEKHIGDIVRRTRERLGHVLVIDDGSNDQTAQRAREAGAEIRTETQVDGIRTRHGRAIGVTLATGDELEADLVVSSVGPHLTFLKFVDARELPSAFVDDVRLVSQ